MCGDCDCVTGLFMCCIPCCWGCDGRLSDRTDPSGPVDLAEAVRPSTYSRMPLRDTSQLPPRAVRRSPQSSIRSKSPLPRDVATPKPSRGTLTQAHAQLANHLNQQATTNQVSAINALQALFVVEPTETTILSAVPLLDTLLFNPQLSSHLNVTFDNLPSNKTKMLQGICLPRSISFTGVTSAKIRLNRKMLAFEMEEEVWGTLVHEMLHAWLDLMAGWRGLLRTHHGKAFESSCGLLVERLGLCGLDVGYVC